MGSQFDSDLPPGARYLADTNVLSEADIDQAIASCEVARAGPGRRFNTQLGRAYAARAVLLASKGSDADARNSMNKAIAQWNAAEAQGSGAAMNFLGAVYKGSFNSPTFTFFKDYSKALEYWLRGDRAGNLKAARNAGGMLLLGPEEFPGVAQDIGKARELLTKAINGGDMTAASLYGQALFYGYPPGVGKNHGAEGLNYLIRACNAGDPSAKAFFDTEFAKSRRSPLLPPTRPAGC
jgi:TPR repeat protein